MSAFETDPLGWTEEWDETYQCYFFFHAATGESSWERPVGLPESEDAKLFALEKTSSQEQKEVEVPTEITDDIVEEAAIWTVAWDDNYNSEFYYNTVTGETLWEKPPCLLALQSNDEVKSDEAASLDPANWSCEWDATYGCDFYFNSVTQESSWDRPACLGEKKEEESQEKTEDKESGGTVEEVIESISNVEVAVTTPVTTSSKRRNSVMRRPSARPDMLVIKKAYVANIPLPSTIPEVSETTTESEIETKTETMTETETDTNPQTTTETETPVVTPAVSKPKRRQSMAPRPAALPPKPLFVPVGKEGVILEGDEEEEDDARDNDERNAKLLPTEVINEIMQSQRHLDVSGSGGSSSGDIAAERRKPRAIGTYLMKKSPALMKGWQKRYVVIKNGALKYFGTKEEYDAEKEPKGEIKISQIIADDINSAIYLSGSAKKEMHVRIKGDETANKKLKASKDRLLMLQAVDAETAQSWVDILKEWVAYVNEEQAHTVCFGG